MNLPPKRIRNRRTKPKVSRRKEILRIRKEINKRDPKSIEKISETKSYLSKKINKTDKRLGWLINTKKK